MPKKLFEKSTVVRDYALDNPPHPPEKCQMFTMMSKKWLYWLIPFCLLWLTQTAYAAILSTSGAVIEIAPPPSVELHQTENNAIIAFNEKQNHQLTVDLPVNISEPGVYQSASDLTPAVLPAGSLIDSHFIQLDPLGTTSTTRQGTITFITDVVGIIVLDAELNTSDIMGAASTTYPTGLANRGLEFSQADQLTLSTDRRTITMTLGASIPLDQIRVLTLGQVTDNFVVGGFDEQRSVVYSLANGSGMEPARQAIATNLPNISLTSSISLTVEALAGLDAVYLPVNYDGSTGIAPLTPAEQTVLTNFVETGGCAIIMGDSASFANPSGLLDPFGLLAHGFLSGIVTAQVDDPDTHPITNGPFGRIETFSQDFAGWLSGNEILILAHNSGGPALIVKNQGSGLIIAYSDQDSFRTRFAENEALFLNTLHYCLRWNNLAQETITLTPITAVNPINTLHTVTATLQTGDSIPIVGRPVTFTIIAGPHSSQTHTKASDAAGQATYTYVGMTPGVDQIEATSVNSVGIVVTANPITKTWVSTATGLSRGMAWGDWDNDGDLDLAVANFDEFNQVLENDQGELKFDPDNGWGWQSPDELSSWSVAWGDWDNDGDLDLAVGNKGQVNQVFENEAGTLSLDPDNGFGWQSLETDNTRSVAWGDWDGDGDLDLATVGNSLDQVYENEGGTLQLDPINGLGWQIPVDQAGISRSAAWGDWDDDGDLDLAIANFGGTQLFENDGGTLQLNPANNLGWEVVDPTRIMRSVAWGDWDGDGDLDLAIGSKGIETWATNQVFENDNETLNLMWESPDEKPTWSVTWGDWDGDGDLDLAVGNGAAGNQIFENTGGDLQLDPDNGLGWISPDTDRATFDLAWGDSDNDSDLDLALANNGQPNQFYQFNGGTLQLDWESSGDERPSRSVAWGDWDDDGDLDLAVANFNALNQVLENDQGEFKFDPDNGWGWQSPDVRATWSVAWGDWDGDGDLDLAVGNRDQANQVFENEAGTLSLDPDNGFGWQSLETDNTRSVAWGDWDDDGDLDLAIVGNGLDRVYENEGGTLQLDPDNGLGWQGLADQAGISRSVAWGDWDDDGDLDLAIANLGGAQLFENENGTLQLDPINGIGWELVDPTRTMRSVAWGDWDGDGDLDLALGATSPITGTWATNQVFENESGTLSVVWESPDEKPTWSVAWGDWDGDGDLDLVVGNGAAGNQIFENTGGDLQLDPDNGLGWLSPDTDRATFSVAWGDSDQDGDLDLALANEDQPNQLYKRSGRRGLRLGNSASYVALSRPGDTADAAFFSTPQHLAETQISILYRLFDQEGDPVRHIIPEYSLNGGGQWLPATLGLGGDGLTDLSAAPTGTAYNFVWNLIADLGSVTMRDNVVFRLRVQNNHSPIQFAALDAQSPTFRPRLGEQITLAPLSATKQVSTSHTVTATLQTLAGTPVVGRDVTFTILSGPHSGQTHTATSDANGQGTFTYLGTLAGTDDIGASFVDSTGATINAQPVTVVWQANAIVQIVPFPATIPLGATDFLTVTVMPGSAEVNGVQIHGQVDPTHLHLVDVQPTTVLPIELDPVAFDPLTGEFRYGAGILGQVITDPFAILVLEVQAVATTTGTAVEFLDSHPATTVTGPAGRVLGQAQNGLVIIPPAPVLQGTVDLQGRPAKPAASWAIPLTISLIPVSNPNITHTFSVTTDQTGAFALPLLGITPGLHDIRVKGDHTLRNLAANTVLTLGDNVYFLGQLLEGDVETVSTFNQVFLDDFGILSGSINQCEGDSGFVPNANLDESEDGCVTIIDFGLLAGNYLTEGDILVPAIPAAQRSVQAQTKQPAAKVRLKVDATASAVEAGQEITVPLVIDPLGEAINGATIHLRFDPALVAVTSVTVSDALPIVLAAPQIDNQQGLIRFSAGVLGQTRTEPFIVAHLSITLKTIDSAITFTPADSFPTTQVSSLAGPIQVAVETEQVSVNPNPENRLFIPIMQR